jgi:hypothetical protein
MREDLNINFDWKLGGCSLRHAILNFEGAVRIVTICKILHNYIHGVTSRELREFYYSNIDSWINELSWDKKELENVVKDSKMLDIVLEMERLKDKYYRETEESQKDSDWRSFDIANEAIVAINKCIDIIKNKH